MVFNQVNTVVDQVLIVPTLFVPETLCEQTLTMG